MIRFDYVYRWKNNEMREKYFGRRCRIVAHGARHSVLVEFENGERTVTGRYAVRNRFGRKAGKGIGRMVDEAKKEKATESVEAKVAKRPKQESLPGMEDRKLADVEKAIDLYCEARDARMAAGEVEVEMKAKLISTTRKHGLSKYKRGPFSCEVASKEIVKARNGGDEKKSEDE